MQTCRGRLFSIGTFWISDEFAPTTHSIEELGIPNRLSQLGKGQKLGIPNYTIFHKRKRK